MSSSTVEVLDANIVVVLSTLLTRIAAASLFESDELKPYMKGVSVGQGLQLDTTSGALGPVFAFESMRSQRAVNIGPNRIEVHERSGKLDFDSDDLAFILGFLVQRLEASVSNVGTNLEVTFTLPGEQTAAEAIAEKLFRQGTGHIPEETQPAGGAGRIFLKGAGNVRYTVFIEPRLNNPETREIWMTSNANIVTAEMPTPQELAELVRQNVRVMKQVAISLFSVSW